MKPLTPAQRVWLDNMRAKLLSTATTVVSPSCRQLRDPPAPEDEPMPPTRKRDGAGLVIYHPSAWAVLLVRDTRTDLWSFPKGRAEAWDRDLIDTAVRETYEETGMVLDINYRLLSRDLEAYGNTYLTYAEATTADLPFICCAEQHVAEVAWVPVHDIPLQANFALRAWASGCYRA